MNCLRIAAVGLVLLSLGISVGAQDAPAHNEILANGNIIHSLRAAPVLGQPYSATVVNKTTRTLADGTTISHHGHHFVARDSEGRVHAEVRIARARNGHPDRVMVFVTDPVAHTLTMWVTGVPADRRTALAIKIPAKPKPAAAPRPTPSSNRPPPIVTIENLPPDTLQGIPVTVVRKSMTVPVGRAGNDAPIMRTLEIWTSPELKLMMKEQWDDPRSGERIVELDNFSRAEPDPALFRPPAGYTVKTVLQSIQEMEKKLAATQN